MNERILLFIKYLDISIADFEKMVGLSNGAVSKMGDGTRNSTIDKISNKYPELNIVWLKTGSGQMLNSEIMNNGNNSTQIKGNENQINSNEVLLRAMEEIAEQRKLVAKSQEQIDRMLSIIEEKNKTINYFINNLKLG